jgi:hypothetical protein
MERVNLVAYWDSAAIARSGGSRKMEERAEQSEEQKE